ncbi:MAG: hypothetical protein HY741_19645 [Chloroflexi bacterium]|nr:hypothetical protein [Chloroflexota bacterium]
MAIANRTAGVTRGYKPKAKRAAKCEPSVWRRAAASLRQGAREIVAFAQDEIVYATMDTLHLLAYLRYELRIETRTRVEPVVQEWESFVQEHELIRDVGTFAVEQVGTFKR